MLEPLPAWLPVGSHLSRLKRGPALTDAIVVTTGTEAYRDPNGIAIVPASLLGP